MKIVHICIGNFYSDGYSYQENMLPKFHKKMGLDVYVIAGLGVFDENGRFNYLLEGKDYEGDYHIKVSRMNFRGNIRIAKKMKNYNGIYEKLSQINPDIVFVHNCQFICINQVIKYLRQNPNVCCYVDNHADYSNSATNWISKNIQHDLIWKKCANDILPFTKKFYGVLPARVDFLINEYGLPREKCELLVMGADDDLVKESAKKEIRNKIRNIYGVKSDELLICTGGKINSYRPETLSLMEAVGRIDNPNVKLLVFGNVSEELKEKFNKLCANDRIIYIGWVKSTETYSLFAASDLIVFPGLHSVMWEQAVAQGKPCIFRKIDGFDHVDLGGNAVFLEDVSEQGIRTILRDLIDHPDKLSAMKSVAEDKGMTTFSYLNIAKRSIEKESETK